MGRVQIDAVTEQAREFGLEVEEGQAGDVAGFELDQHVHVAVRTEVVPQDRAEER